MEVEGPFGLPERETAKDKNTRKAMSRNIVAWSLPSVARLYNATTQLTRPYCLSCALRLLECAPHPLIDASSVELQQCVTPFQLEMLQTVPLFAAAEAAKSHRTQLGGFKPSLRLQDLAFRRAAAHRDGNFQPASRCRA